MIGDLMFYSANYIYYLILIGENGSHKQFHTYELRKELVQGIVKQGAHTLVALDINEQFISQRQN